MVRRAAAGALTVCLLAALAAPLPSALGATAPSFSALPSTYNPKQPSTSSYFQLTIPPGGRRTQTAVVANLSSRPLTLLVYPVDGLTGATSGAVYSNYGVAPRRAGRYLHPALSRIVLAPHSRRLVPFTVALPRRIASGDHLAGIAFQDSQPIAASRGRFAVREIVRVVLGVEVVVPGPTRSAIAITNAHLGRLGATNLGAVYINLENRGLLICKPQLTVALAGPPGAARSAKRNLDSLLPQEAIDYPFPWPFPLPAGSYRIAVTAAGCGRLVSYRSAPAALLQPLGGSVQAGGPPSRSKIPWTWVGGTAGAFALGLLLGAARRRRGATAGHATS